MTPSSPTRSIHSPQPVAPRDVVVRLRGPDLHHADHHPAHRGAGDRGARLGARARRPGRAHPARAGVRLPRPPLLRLGGVRPLLAEGGRQRRAGGHALLRQRLRAVCRTTGRAVTARCSRSSPRPSGCCRPGDRSRTPCRRSICHGALSRFPALKVAVIENGSSWVAPLLEQPGRRLQEDAAGLLREPGRGRSSATSTSAPSGRRTSASWPSSSGWSTCCSGPTTRTPRASPTRRATSDELQGLDEESVRKIMGGNLATLMNVAEAATR